MSLPAAVRTVRILWAALLLSVVMYVGLVVGGVIKSPPQPPPPSLLSALRFMALAVATASLVVPRILYKQAVAKVTLDTIDATEPGAFAAGYRDATPKVRVFASRTDALTRALTCFQPSFIISLALSESVALFGLVICVMGFEKIAAAPFFVIGAALMAIRFPGERDIIAPFEAALGATIPPDQA